MNLRDATIYDGIEELGLQVDLQGWHSEDPIFERVIAETQPETIIEVGSWKGASAIHMAELTSNRDAPGSTMPEPHLYCVDTWLGSLEHVLHPERPGHDLLKRHGYPQLYYQFLHNVKMAGFADRVTPLPMPSIIAARLLDVAQVKAETIYIDSSHLFGDVLGDLTDYWPLLRPGGIMFGDDLNRPDVYRAVFFFATEQVLMVDLLGGNFWVMRKAKE